MLWVYKWEMWGLWSSRERERERERELCFEKRFNDKKEIRYLTVKTNKDGNYIKI